ncbi:hypothetical protein [Actibacterium ureilyticum]|uniref:hypothetical protein n=1 Tax=Actibacterium ureilyticum TaxID=1590614 RepID=UPI000BAB23FF|nr:hypothetical protein [Actibacterium ureilyticum]
MTRFIMVFAFLLGLSGPVLADTPNAGEDNTAKPTWTLSAKVMGTGNAKIEQIKAELAAD